MNTNAPIFVGIDVSNAFLDSATRPNSSIGRDPNDPQGIAALLARLVPILVVEATGGLELPLNPNPLEIRSFSSPQ